MVILTKAKTKFRICVHCGHRFKAHDQRQALSDPQWLPAASHYCSQDCCDRYHREIVHSCSKHVKEKARRDAARAAQPKPEPRLTAGA